MKRMIRLFGVLFVLAVCSMTGCKNEPLYEASVGYDVVDGVIILDEPKRSEGQQSVLELRCEPLDTVRVGFVGLGMRGPGAVERFTYIDGVKINALCDKYEERAEACQRYLEAAGMPKARVYSGDEGYKELCQSEDIDLVYIATPWQLHVAVAVYAMEHGKHVAIEVPSANTVEECWQLVDTSERTRRHCMMLENCVYDFFELTCLNMAQQGLFGEILHAEGAYIHNLSDFWDDYHNNWRLDFNQKNRGDVYATHGFGPVCMALNMHRGNRMNYLVCMDTKSVIGLAKAKEKMGATEFANGDQTTTLIRTENGKVIQLHHNIVTPRPYSRDYALVGTQGYAVKYPIQAFRIGNDVPEGVNPVSLKAHPFMSDEERDALLEQYKHPIIKEVGEVAKKVGGHGGMDFIMDYRLVYCLRNGLPLDMDVYDAAEWSAMGELTRISIENGSKPVKVPDFTRGNWDKVDGLTFYFAE